MSSSLFQLKQSEPIKWTRSSNQKMEALRKLANLCSLKARVGSAESQFLLLAVKRTHVKLIFFILPLVCFDSVSYIFVRHGDREEEWRLFCNPPVNILPERRQPGLLSAVPQGEAAAAHLGALLQPGHAHWRLHRRRHHCPHSHTTGDRWVSFLYGLPIMINIQILPNINLRFEYFCSYNSSDIQRESFVTFKSANIITSYVANELNYLNQNYGFFCRTGA